MSESWEENQKYVIQKLNELMEQQKETQKTVTEIKESLIELKIKSSLMGFFSGILGSSASHVVSWFK